MARCPFAIWHVLSGDVGRMNQHPAKIVHHTTEGTTVAGAMTALGAKHADSHFVAGLDKEGKFGPKGGYVIVQLIDTSMAARALKNLPGGVETNKDNAIQIEAVGFAAKPKDPKTLALVAKLSRWIEQTHGVPRAWPNGLPKVATAKGQDPGGHNRNAHNWETRGGHYGHSQAPENSHWDPAYTVAELKVIMGDGWDPAHPDVDPPKAPPVAPPAVA